MESSLDFHIVFRNWETGVLDVLECESLISEAHLPKGLPAYASPGLYMQVSCLSE